MPDPSNIPAGCRFHPRCPQVLDRCRTEPPPLVQDASGQVECFLAAG
jgi:oligopeptide/dipeptide ABC transporter ATP-binding protein